MQRTKKLKVVLAILMLMLQITSFNIKNVFAWHNTPVQTVICEFYGEPVAKMGTTTQYGYIGPSGERSPQFYSALIASGSSAGVIYQPDKARIEVSGISPNGSPLPGDSFGDLSVLVSPDDSGVEQVILRIAYDTLIKILPPGPSAVVKNTITEGGATTGRDVEKAWGEWWDYVTHHEEKGLRFGYELNVDPTLEGTYTLDIHYLAEIWWHHPQGSHLIETLHLYDTVEYEYVNTPLTPSRPSGETDGYTYTTYTYSTDTTDPNGDSLRYQFDWGDGTDTTTGWYASGATASASHYWTSSGTYNVKVRAQDATSAWSDWSSSLEVGIGDPVHYLTISVGYGGTTEPPPTTYTYEWGTSVEVQAIPDSGYDFDYWIIDGATKYDNPITVTMDADHDLKAYFEEDSSGGGGGDNLFTPDSTCNQT